MQSDNIGLCDFFVKSFDIYTYNPQIKDAFLLFLLKFSYNILKIIKVEFTSKNLIAKEIDLHNTSRTKGDYEEG